MWGIPHFKVIWGNHDKPLNLMGAPSSDEYTCIYIYTHWKYIDTISIHIQSIRLHLYMEYGEFSISMWACQRVSVTYSHDFKQTFGSRSGWWINSNIHELITNIFPWIHPHFPGPFMTIQALPKAWHLTNTRIWGKDMQFIAVPLSWLG